MEAFVDSIGLFLPQNIYEFYYTCTHDEQSDVIQGAVRDGFHAIRLTISILRDALHLPNLVKFLDPPSEKQCRKVIMNMGYDCTKQGKHTGLILRQCLLVG